MTGGGGTISSLTEIGSRKHSDLQNLLSQNDHLGYLTGAPSNDVITSWNAGLDASKSATPTVGSLYIATDTDKLYYCNTVDVWSERKAVSMDALSSIGDIPTYDGGNIKNVSAGTKGQFLRGEGANNIPTYALASQYLYLNNFTPTGSHNSTFTTQDSFVLPAGILTPNSIVKIKMSGLHYNANGAATFEWRILTGSISLGGIILTSNGTAGEAFLPFEYTLYILGGSSLNLNTAIMFQNSFRGSNTATQVISAGSGTLNFDNSSANTIELQEKDDSSGTYALPYLTEVTLSGLIV